METRKAPGFLLRLLTVAPASLAVASAVALGASMQAEQSPARVGDVVPDFTLPALDGGEHTLSQRRGADPVVLVFFRGVW